MNCMENIISNLSVRITQGFKKHHNSTWTEHKRKLEYTLWSIMEGNIYINAGHRDYTVCKGDAVLFYPGTEYFAHTDKDGCDFVVVRFSLNMGNDIDLFYGLNLAGIAKGISDKTLEFCHDFMPNNDFGWRTSFEQYIVFMNYINSVIKVQKSDSAVLFSKRTHVVERTIIQEAIDYIAKNYADVTVKDVAKRVHLHEKRFIANFKKTVGISPGQYIYRCKMARATELLSDTSMKITDISEMLGFANPYSFSKSFKNSFGESPTDFRKNAM